LQLTLRAVFAILLILLLSWPSLLKVAVFANWQINREYIAQNLCENRQKPESDCEGNCQLVKETGKTEDSHSPAIPAKTIEKINLEIFDCLTTDIQIPGIIREIEPLFSFTAEINNPLFSKPFFHPPEVV